MNNGKRVKHIPFRCVFLLLSARLRNHNATDDDNVDFRSFLKNLHSKLGKLMQGS